MSRKRLDLTLPMFDAPAIMPAEFTNLRPYQTKGINKVRGISLTKKRILVVGPTGCGKSVVFSNIIKTSTLPVLFVCDRVELIDQAVEHLARQGITNVGVIRADDPRENPSAQVQVASIQTLTRRDPPFMTTADQAVAQLGSSTPGPVRCQAEIIIIIDEAHLCASDSFKEYVFDRYPNAIIIGLTATPSRLDGRPLGALFDHLEILVTYEELFKNPNWLVAPDVYSAPVQVDLTKLHVSKMTHDYEEAELAQVMNTRELTGQVVDHWLARAHMHPVFKDGIRQPGQFVEGERRRTFGFAVDIQHSMALCERFEKAGIKVAHLDHKTPENERKAMLRDLESGELEIVWNVEILTKGVDIVPAKCVIHARPTKSLILWRQSCGRIFRPWRGVIPLILDHARNYDEHFAPHEDRLWSLTHGSVRHKGSAPMRLCPGCYAYVVASKTVCPYCNVPFPAPQPGEMPTETKETLELRSHDPDAAKKKRFNDFLITARTQGFKVGWVSWSWKKHYGEFPPFAWSDIAKAEFEKDSLWQALVTRREERKKARKEQELKEQIAELPQEAPAGWKCDTCGGIFRGIGGACVKCFPRQPLEPDAKAPEDDLMRRAREFVRSAGQDPDEVVTDDDGSSRTRAEMMIRHEIKMTEDDPWGLRPPTELAEEDGAEAPFADWLEGELGQ